jgi:hypothetical protein
MATEQKRVVTFVLSRLVHTTIDDHARRYRSVLFVVTFTVISHSTVDSTVNKAQMLQFLSTLAFVFKGRKG